MDNAAAILLAFAVQWGDPRYQKLIVAPSELHEAETALGVRFPEDYNAGILSGDLPSFTPALLSAIVETQIDLRELWELKRPSEIVEQTLSWREIGLPKNLIVIGSDSMGNMFCFDVTTLQGDRVTSAEVYFWDHDFGTVELVGASFPEWIGGYVGEWSTGLTYRDF